MSSEKVARMAVISGASKALKLKEENPSASDTEILREISQNMNDILNKIDVGN